MSEASVDAYLARLTPGQREALQSLRAQVAQLIPDAIEAISYGIPAFQLHGETVLGYAGWKKHCRSIP